ncbi:complex I subunit 5 family protein [Thioalkalivibrio sulfidiphilus]|uniref:NADH dehydrogenase (Quinone) n=1 Tax=Thioalkalivibrio sulfidiphilus (strain HL-EbGR7) TaxID=396588 RepID=B8GMS3_THISH|nr:proton-conducting transporter membrane subunit [Thioalkalivibrio sulfidiphilus]ACL73738.1 NADH dehydrogenase (quinone) [Thioalkalivibrio sulfidiphilus HL-EbGr7]
MFATGLDWAAWAVAVPLVGALLAGLLPRLGPVLGLVFSLLTALAVAGAVMAVWHEGPVRAGLGGWDVPLGIALSLDGLAALMLAMTAVVGLAVSIYALGYLHSSQTRGKFWTLWLWLWASMNALFLSGDVFNIYVTLELVGLAAVALTALSGGAAALGAAMRYLLVSLLGSLAYLMGVALLYGGYGVLDLAALGAAMEPDKVSRLAAVLMTVGLLMKTALFPLHVWLPPAHGSAPAPVSAVLSALVVKASFYLILRLWLDVFPALTVPGFELFMGALGAGALLWGSVLALRAARLKQVVAYSTVAQLGYLFLVFPLMAVTPGAWQAVVFFALAHACAKATVFLAAGSLQQAAGHDRLAQLGAVMRKEPVTVFAFGIAGASLVGLPLTGGFIAKWLLVDAALQGHAWGWASLVLAGGLLAGGYVFRVLGHAFGRGPVDPDHRPVPAVMVWSTLVLALVSVALGFAGAASLELLALHGGQT